MRLRLIVATSLLLASCAGGPSVPAGCEVMSDPSACDPGKVIRTEVLAPGERPNSQRALYCGAVIHLANALQLYSVDPPRAPELLQEAGRSRKGKELGFDPSTCY
jgi:hypothetical protein